MTSLPRQAVSFYFVDHHVPLRTDRSIGDAPETALDFLPIVKRKNVAGR